MATTLGRSRRVIELPIRLDGAIENQGERVRAALRAAIVDGLLAPGTKLPSSRALAAQIGVRRNAVVAAFEHLLSDGLVEARQGSGTFVAAALPTPAVAPSVVPPVIEVAPRRPFALGFTTTDRALLGRLAAAARRHIVEASDADLGYGDPRGSGHLRHHIAEHLAAHRGVRCDPAAIVVVNGTQHGLRLCAEALLTAGDAVWMEEPGYYASRRTLEACGLAVVPVPVDRQGIVIDRQAASAGLARAVYVTPSHQFPTGATMSMARRVALLEWAEATGGLIIEDDYDSEFRYAGAPLTALAGLGSSRVIYLGTFTKTLFAALRIAYVVLPPALVSRVVDIRATHDRFPPLFMQEAVADLIADGTFAAHVRRMRSVYREARDVLVATLFETAGDALDVAIPGQGLHLVARLPDGLPRSAARSIAEKAGIEARLVSETRSVQQERDGFILGFSGHGIAEIRSSARRLGLAARKFVAENCR